MASLHPWRFYAAGIHTFATGGVLPSVDIPMLSYPQVPPAVLGGMLLVLCTTIPLAEAITPSGSAALTSDYVWRGSSQNQGSAAIQGGFKASADIGVYASVWGSSVNFGSAAGASTELDGVFGWSGTLAPDWALDVNLTRYQYPGSSADLDWNEFGATVTWTRDYWLQVGVSDDALAGGHAGTYVQVGARMPVNDALRFEAAVGRYYLSNAYADDYAHCQLGAVWAFAKPLELRVSAHFTDNAAKRLFPGQAGSRLEVALQGTF